MALLLLLLLVVVVVVVLVVLLLLLLVVVVVVVHRLLVIGVSSWFSLVVSRLYIGCLSDVEHVAASLQEHEYIRWHVLFKDVQVLRGPASLTLDSLKNELKIQNHRSFESMTRPCKVGPLVVINGVIYNPYKYW